MGIPDHLTCLFRNLYAGQEATFRARYGIKDSFKIGKGVLQGYTLSPYLFNLYTEHFMTDARRWQNTYGRKWRGTREPLDESKRRMKHWFKLNIQKPKVMASGPITSWQIDRNNGNSERLYIGRLQNHCRWWPQHLLFARKVMNKIHSILKSKDTTLPAKVHLLKAMTFLVVMYRCESWTIKKAECLRTDTFEL